MTRASLNRRLRALDSGEGGFTIVETMIAITMLFAAIVALSYTATIGFRSIAFARERVTANGIANRIVEEIRGQAYARIQTGLSTSDLSGDTNIKACGGSPVVYRFESCSAPTGEKIVHSSGVPAEPWINPHQGTIAASSATNDLAYSWKTYITNDCPSIETVTPCPSVSPYRVTVLVSWASAAHPNSANSSVRIQSLFSSPSGCVSSATHPFAAPCQPFFYGIAQVPPGRVDISGTIQGLTFASGFLQLTGTEANLQNEQVTQGRASFTESLVSVTDGAGTREAGGVLTTATAADSDPGTAGVRYASSPVTVGAGGSVSSTNGSTAIDLVAPSGDTGLAQAAVAAAGANICPPPTDVAEVDGLPCLGGRVQQAGTVGATLKLNGIVGGLGTATLASMDAPAQSNRSFVDREAVAGGDGRVELTATRSFGTIGIGGLPSGMSAPGGWTGYLVNVAGYQDTATSQAGSTTASGPATTVGGTVSFWNGSGYTTYAADNSSLNNLSSSVIQTAAFGGNTVTTTISVKSGSQTTARGVNDTNPSGSLRTDVDSSVTPFTATVLYRVTVDGITTVDLAIDLNLGTMLSRGVYGQPPAAG
jgi:type II secretory pathway pseudopilin PulG